MSGVNNAAVKQDTNQFKKDGRGSTGNTPNIKEEKRSSDSSFTSPSNQSRGHGHHGSQHNENQNRDRSGNRNDSRHYEKHAQETKSHEKDDKAAADQAAATSEKKFTGRCRLFVGNLTPDMSEDEFRKMFEAYGEVSEVYANTSRGFGFIRLDYRHNAEAAKAALDGMQRKGRILRVRFATHGAALKVKNLHPYVSNELLEQSFSQFGELERCVVIVDDRGKSTGEGIVEFVRKPGANSALRRITEGVFLMGMDPKPISVEPLEHKDEEDGLPEKFLTRSEQYKKEREKEPRFAPPGTFEYEFGMRWKQLEDLEKQRIEQAKKDTEDARLKLEDEMQNALYDYQADQIRQELVRQQEELRRLEELRNQDRMRRQQEYDLRHQQEERERAQQEERRRADAMMMMRQQDLARGRGSMDMSVMKGRDEIMMGDRYGDRMPDHLSDRIGDRMSDRMGDRMGPGQSGYPSLWDDKQRGEAGMRGDTGRGRGSGAPPLQPPPVPPSSVGAMERGGPNPASSGGTAQGGAKTSPKPLMQAGGFGNIGNTPGGAPPSNAPNAADANSMDDDCVEEVDTSHFDDAAEGNDNEVETTGLGRQEACLATFRSPDITSGDEPPEVCTSQQSCQLQAKAYSFEGRMHVDLLESDVASKTINDITDPSKASEGKPCLEVSDITCGNHEQSMSDCDIDHEDGNHSLECIRCPDDTFQCGYRARITSDSQSGFDNSSKAQSICDEQFKTLNSVPLPKVMSTDSDISCPDAGIKSFNTQMAADLTTSHDVEAVQTNDCGKTLKDIVANDRKCYSPSSDHLNDVPDVAKPNGELLELSSSINGGAYHFESNDLSPDFSSVSRINQHSTLSSYSDDSCQPSKTVCHQSISIKSPSNLPNLCTVISDSTDPHKLDQFSESYTSSVNSKCLDIDTDIITDSVSQESNYSTKDTITTSCNQNVPHESYKQSVSEEDSKYEQLEVGSYEQNKTLIHEPSMNQISETSHHVTHCDQSAVDVEVSSYKQHIFNDAEEMETETVDDDDDVTCVPVNSGIYQSYEDVDYQTTSTALVEIPGIAQYDTSDGDSKPSETNPIDDISKNVTNSLTPNGESSDKPSTSVITENTVLEATSSTEDPLSANTSSSPSLSSKQSLGTSNGDQEERGFTQGDQPFISAAVRQPTTVPFLPAGCALPYVPGMNPSMYAGAAMVQGMAGPTVMTSSSVHIAQHPGGATIMQHRHMSTGINGGLTQATVMQQQAMPNGLQATSVLQRTLTNGGQTMVVQQRTMTTGLDGVTQQTVVQQQVAAPGMAQAAMFHANAIRQRTLATQQASMMQQRGIRLVQTGVMGNPVMHAQPIGGATLIQGGAMTPTALIGHGLLRGVSQGTMMQQIVRQRYLGGPVMPGRGVQLMAGRPIRVKMTYPRESMPMDT